MRRILSLALSAAMIISSVPFAYAANDYRQGTQVIYTADNVANENWTITVPAKLQPGASGTVTLEGYWPSNKTITVDADDTVTLTNSILSSDTKTLNITFLGITKSGNNTERSIASETVSVQAIENALFGTWNGSFYYNVETSENIVDGCNTLVWDGDTTDLVHTLGEVDYFYKVSDSVPTYEDLMKGITVYGVFRGEEWCHEYTAEDMIEIMENHEMGNGVFSVDNLTIIPYDNFTIVGDIIAPEKGVYFINAEEEPIYTTKFVINDYTGFEHFDGCPHQQTEEVYYFRASTPERLDEIPEDPVQYDVLLQGDYLYWYSPETDDFEGGWTVMLATEDFALELADMIGEVPDYPWTTRDKTTYGPILRMIKSNPIKRLELTFMGCENLTDVPEIPDTVTYLGETFIGCTSLTETPDMPDSVTTLYGTFAMCANLKSATIPPRATNISGAFSDCESLVETPVIPTTITDMSWTFSGCSQLVKPPKIPEGVLDMGSTFYGCTNLVRVPELPNSVTYLTQAFCDCTSLTEVNVIIPENVEYIRSMFNGCINLKGTITLNTQKLQDYAAFLDDTTLPIILTGTCPELSTLNLRLMNSYDNITIQQ